MTQCLRYANVSVRTSAAAARGKKLLTRGFSTNAFSGNHFYRRLVAAASPFAKNSKFFPRLRSRELEKRVAAPTPSYQSARKQQFPWAAPERRNTDARARACQTFIRQLKKKRKKTRDHVSIASRNSGARLNYSRRRFLAAGNDYHYYSFHVRTYHRLDDLNSPISAARYRHRTRPKFRKNLGRLIEEGPCSPPLRAATARCGLSLQWAREESGIYEGLIKFIRPIFMRRIKPRAARFTIPRYNARSNGCNFGILNFPRERARGYPVSRARADARTRSAAYNVRFSQRIRQTRGQ